MKRIWLAMLLLPALASCWGRVDVPEPPRVDDAPHFDEQISTVTAPVAISLDQIQAALRQRIPRQLWSINEREEACIPAETISIGDRRVEITPDISCRLVGTVTRGPITLGGSGSTLLIQFPVNATVSAREVAGTSIRETATGSAVVRLEAQFTVGPDWQLQPDIEIAYGWSEPPGIEILGQRIQFVSLADRELGRVIASLEREMETALARTDVRSLVSEAWAEGFAVVELNRENPQAWMRITPRELAIAGIEVRGRQLLINAGLEAVTETFVGERPEANDPTPLPQQAESLASPGVHFVMPVIASYAELEPVLLRELREMNERGIALEGVGTIEADFKSVTMYATENDRLAVGIEVDFQVDDEDRARDWTRTEGMIWLTGVPYNEPNDRTVEIHDLELYGDTDRLTGDLLVRFAMGPALQQRIASALTEDFTNDYNDLLEDAEEAIAELPIDNSWMVRAEMGEVRHGRIRVTGPGLFLPVEIDGEARIELALPASR
ncbi:DUF4403 family protein [Parasphingopyxis sp. CP4]|uniref:DUF4403 family protein n=1 Tax=Parasphingopyxis sp. CP4 TaxID=2724527 RepID=UPI0015A3ECB0|nr:DUF4403 family protein [Parasphingopyxis sp. CP4]QLC21998.1 DUF4403 family protein [Parasphingopyxis sp. CP4]